MAGPGNATAGTGGTVASQAALDSMDIYSSPKTANMLLPKYLYLVLGSISVALVVWRVSTLVLRHVRHIAGLNNDRQTYFAQASEKVSFFKKSIQYAPIFGTRHNREFQLSSAVNMGTLPSRLQLLFLLGYVATNVVFCVIAIDFSGKYADVANTLRNRTGVLATVNMVPLFLMAGRNNPLIPLLGISFDTFNLLHRWFGRIVVLETLAHVLAFLLSSASRGSWATAINAAVTVPYLMFGFIATCAMVAILIQSPSAIRHAFYEVFKLLHIGLAALSVVGLYYHLQLKNLPQIDYVWTVIVLWLFDRTARMVRLAYHNIGAGGTQTLVEALPGGACRITVSMARPWNFKPGQHAYLYFPSISFWQSHPFSVAWSEEAVSPKDERLPLDRGDVLAMKKNTMSFVVRGRTGFTAALYRKAEACPEGRLITRCLAEGPYGNNHTMHSYGTVMLFAGGVGITQAVPHVRDLVAAYSNGTAATRKVVLVWTIQSPEHLEWIRPWMTEILALEKRREVLRIMLFVSRPRSTKEIHSPSATVQMFPGRPNIDTLLAVEMENQVGALGVSVCGPGALSDEVRRAVRKKQYLGTIDFVEEAFSW